jgi:hypothetical protein
MSGLLRQSLHRLRSLFRDTQLDTELDAEMAAHLDLAVEENIHRGMSPEEARRQALIRFGGAAQAQEKHRDTLSLPLLDEFSQDLRYALRTFRRDRAFVAIAIIILTLGIGANIAVFSVATLSFCALFLSTIPNSWSSSPPLTANPACPASPTPSTPTKSSNIKTILSRV